MVGTVTGQQEGRVTDLGDERLTQRLLDVRVEEVLKGTVEPGSSILWYDANWSEGGGESGRTLEISSENHGFEPGERALLALVPGRQGENQWGLHSTSAYFLLGEDGSIVVTERTNPAADEAQRLPIDERKAQLRSG